MTKEKKVKKTTKKKNEKPDFEEKWLRAQADYQNLQKDMERQRSEWAKMSKVQAIEEFLPVFDNFKKAFSYQDNLSDDRTWQNWAKGIEYIMKQFENIIEQNGIEIIKTVGEGFDPKYHEAVSEEDGEEGKILREVDTGYKMGDKVLKAAKVVVGK
jgi:molecular chaperone GrpE